MGTSANAFWGNTNYTSPSSSVTSVAAKSDLLTDEVKFNGSPMTDVISANEETGEIHYYERHWHTNERIADGTDPTGYRTCREKGKVEVIKKPAPSQSMGDGYNSNDDYYKNNPWYPGGCFVKELRVGSALNLTLRNLKQINLSSIPGQPGVCHLAEFTPVVMDGLTGKGSHFVLSWAAEDGDDLVLTLAPCQPDGSFVLDGTLNSLGAPNIITITFRVKSPHLRIPNVPSDDPATWPANTSIEVRAGSAGAVDADILRLFAKLKVH
jgi:hypothetical protein